MGIPKVSGALKGWTKKTACRIVATAIVNHRSVETTTDAILDIMITPLGVEKTMRKPEEQRAWRWYQAHLKVSTPTAEPLKRNDKIIMATGKTYRIEAIGPWNDAGFIYYELVEDYT